MTFLYGWIGTKYVLCVKNYEGEKPRVVIHSFNLSTQMVETKESPKIQGQCGSHSKFWVCHGYRKKKNQERYLTFIL